MTSDPERDSLKRMERLAHDLQHVILPLGISLSVEKNVDRLLERILLEAKALCHADAGTLYVRTKDDRLKFAIMLTDSLGIALGGTSGREIPFPPLRLHDPETGRPNHHNVATHVALDGRSVNIPDIYRAEAFDFSATRVFDQRNHYRSMSTLTVPLKDNEDHVIAVLQLLNALDPATGQVVAFDDYQQLVVESLSSQAAVAFNNQLLLQRQAELLKFERDLQIGRQIQAGFLPAKVEEPPGWQIAARFRPAREVAGDFYDVFPLSEGRVGLVIADVCDKGVGAALFMALVRSLLRAYAQQRFALVMPQADGEAAHAAARTALKEAVTLTNEYIGQNHLEMNMFATTFAAVLDPVTGTLAYVNGGHNAPVIFGPGGRKGALGPTGPAVGMLPVFDFGVRETRLDPEDVLFAFTDGATDARDPHGAFFTEPRLLALAGEDVTLTAEGLVTRVEETLLAHISTAAQYDDITLLTVRRLTAF
jgi:phosphoserine phosphatase RsbU/P